MWDIRFKIVRFSNERIPGLDDKNRLLDICISRVLMKLKNVEDVMEYIKLRTQMKTKFKSRFYKMARIGVYFCLYFIF